LVYDIDFVSRGLLFSAWVWRFLASSRGAEIGLLLADTYCNRLWDSRSGLNRVSLGDNKIRILDIVF